MFIYAFIMLILLRKTIKVKNYVRNESTIALLEEKLQNTTESICDGLWYKSMCESIICDFR